MKTEHDDIVPINWLDATNGDLPLYGELVFVDGGIGQYREGVWYSGTDTPPLERPITWEVKHWARIRVPVRST